MSIWRRDRKWLKAYALAVRAVHDPEIELAHLACIKRAQMGSPIHYQMMLRALGRWDQVPAEPGDDGRAGVSAVASVTFVGLPTPPSAAERARTVPPAGSAMILRADGVLEDASR